MSRQPLVVDVLLFGVMSIRQTVAHRTVSFDVRDISVSKQWYRVVFLLTFCRDSVILFSRLLTKDPVAGSVGVGVHEKFR